MKRRRRHEVSEGIDTKQDSKRKRYIPVGGTEKANHLEKSVVSKHPQKKKKPGWIDKYGATEKGEREIDNGENRRESHCDMYMHAADNLEY